MGMVEEFKEFIAKGNVMDLAVGVVIGGAFGKIVSSLTDDIIMPLLGGITGGIDFTNKFILLGSGSYPTLKAAKDAGAAVIGYGSFITAIIQFLLISFVIFMMVKAVNRIRRAPAEVPPAPTREEELLTEIRDALVQPRV